MNELEIQLDQANKINADHQLNERRLQQSNNDLNHELELANQAKEEQRETTLVLERRCNMLTCDKEDALNRVTEVQLNYTMYIIHVPAVMCCSATRGCLVY